MVPGTIQQLNSRLTSGGEGGGVLEIKWKEETAIGTGPIRFDTDRRSLTCVESGLR